jgi:hypothetical protein
MGLNDSSEQAEVLVLNVPAIPSKVNSDSARTRQIRENRRRDNPRLVRSSRLSYRRDVIDVNVQPSSLHCNIPLAHLVELETSLATSFRGAAAV